MKSLCNLLAITVLFSLSANANLLTNGSFENGTFVVNAGGGGESLTVGSTAITGWTIVSGETAWLPTTNGFGVTSENGTYLLDLTGYHDTVPYGGVSQTVNLAIGNYTLAFYLGEDQSNGAYAGPVAVSASAGNMSNVIFTSTVPTGSTGNIWQLETLNFSVTTAGNTAISIIGSSAHGGQYIGLDNVDLEAGSLSSTSTPEPAATLPLLCIAGFGLAARLRLRCKTA